MENVKRDIYTSLKTNRIITLVAVITSAIVVALAILSVVNLYRNNNKFIYGISGDKNLMPLEMIDKKTKEEVLIKGHIALFLNYFYSYDQWNYEQQIEKALWLVDDSGKKLYFFYKDNGHFNQLIQSNSSQSIKDIIIELDQSGNFISEAIVEVNKIGQVEKSLYKLTVKGKIIEVSQNYPKNPYGYYITDFKEISKTKITQ